MMREFVHGAIEVLGETDLTLMQLAALTLLRDEPGLPLSELAQLLERSVSATSRLIDQLVRRRLLTRREDRADRRARRIALAAAGERLLDRLIERRAEAQLELVAELSAGERMKVAEGEALLANAARRRAARLGEKGQ
jgi:DNA-binding MarR family transcriptional regulator